MCDVRQRNAQTSEDDLCLEVPECNNSFRYGGPQGEDDDAARKAEEREKKKAEVRKRLEEAGAKKKAKKGFLTPERKKKLRKLLMMKAAEDLKQQQLLKEQERQKVLSQRIIPLPNVDDVDDHAKLAEIYNQLFDHMVKLEEEKYDINQGVMAKDAEINALTIAVNDLRGKYVKPTLKKVSKYDNKFKKMAGVKKEESFRVNLKVVKKENVLDNLVNKQKKTDKPEWSKKSGEKKEGEEEEKHEEEKKTEEPKADAAPEEEAGEEEEGEGEEDEEEEEEEEE